MFLSDIFTQLTYGELATLALSGNRDNPEIPVDKYPQICSYISLGLTELHKRFDLKRGTLTLEQMDEIVEYNLDMTRTESTGSVPMYIKDSLNPYKNDLLKVEKVTKPDGTELPLNKMGNPDSIFTPNEHTITIPKPTVGELLTVNYRQNHTKIDPDAPGFDPLSYRVYLPESLLNALLYFVASRAFATVKIVEGMDAGNVYIAKFEAACRKYSELGLNQVEDNSYDHFSNNGWV